MERKNLTGCKFTDNRKNDYQILSGYEGFEIIYEAYGKNEPLFFCCDAQIINGKLKGTYFVNYSVTKSEFFAFIDNLIKESGSNEEAIVGGLKDKYYKIPTVFLKLVYDAYLKEVKSVENIINAHKLSSENYDALSNNTLYGCFYCLKTFNSSEIENWLLNSNGTKTAVCPYCGIDSVISNTSSYPVTIDFLEKMKKYWF